MRRVVLIVLLVVALAGIGGLTVDHIRSRGLVVERWALTPSWSVDVPGAQTMVYATFIPGAAPSLLIQGPPLAVIVDPSGRQNARASLPSGSRTGATGDLDGDGADELVVARQTRDGPVLDIYDGALRSMGAVGPVKSLGDPARVLVADLDGDGKRELVVGDVTGRIAAVTRQGRPLWVFAFGAEAKGDEAALRGMDDVRTGAKGRLVMAARRKGDVVLIDGRGDVVRTAFRAGLRRARALDLDRDGKDEVVLGGDGWGVSFLRGGGNSAPEMVGGTSGVVTELRRIETDGDPRTTEVVAGNRDGVVWTIARGQVTSFGTVEGRVTEVAGVDTDGDGLDEVFIGSEPDRVTVLDRQGRSLVTINVQSPVARILPLPAQDGRGQEAVVVAGGKTARWSLGRRRAPMWYSPLTVAALGVLMVLLAGAAVVRSGRPLPRLQVTEPAHLSGSGTAAARARIEDLVRRGVVPADMAAERLTQIDAPTPRAGRAPAGPSSPPPPPRRG